MCERRQAATKTTNPATDAEALEHTDAKKQVDEHLSGSQKKHSMRVKVYGPFKVYVDEDAYSISAVNYTGPFDVLGEHHKFITILEPCELVVHTLYDTKRIRISRAVMHVSDNKIVVFLDV